MIHAEIKLVITRVDHGLHALVNDNTLLKSQLATLLKERQSSSAYRNTKSASETKAVQSLKILKDKSEFKQRHAKASNAPSLI